MQEIFKFAILGLGLGALYALASQGLMVIYRGSGVLNFAHGSIGMLGAYLCWELQTKANFPFFLAFILGISASALVGAATHLLIMKRLTKASPLGRVVATLGVLIIVQSFAVIRYGAKVKFVKSELPINVVRFWGATVSVDRLILLALSIVLTFGLWFFYRHSQFGISTTAVAENQRTAGSLGLSADRIAALNWALGSGLSGLVAILLSPISSLQVGGMTTLVIAALAAALVASFRSFPIALMAGLAIGIAQTMLTRYVHIPGVPQSVRFAVIVVMLLVRGTALPIRGHFLQKLPMLGSGKVYKSHVALGVATAVVLTLIFPISWQDAMVTTFAMSIILLSCIVVTGIAGQLSLAQFALAGFGAWIAGRSVDMFSVPFPLALILGVCAAVPLGALFALPAVKARGLNLAIVTLGLGSALEVLIFNNGKITGGFIGTKIGQPNLFGYDISATRYPSRYAIFCIVLFVLLALMVASLRRGRSGRRMIAVRTNERAAAALGINVAGVKIYAFALAAGIAAVGGTLLAFRKDTIIYANEFQSFVSITAVGWAFMGGIGFIFGSFFGATMTPGSISARITNGLFSGIDKYVPLIGGVVIVLIVLFNQDGLAKESAMQARWMVTKTLGRFRKAPPEEVVVLPVEIRERVSPVTLVVNDLSVRYGGVVAVDDVSLTVEPGRIVGLIGPNGAGKTSFIDAVTGFTKASAGTVVMVRDEASGGASDVTALSASRRARVGMSRSFQSLELFEDISVLDNLRAASDPRDKLSYIRDLVHAVDPPIPGAVVAAINEFKLGDYLLKPVSDLPYGHRRLLAIARAVATQPNILLLDEPAAGLGETETAELSQLVRRLADDWGIGVLLVEHDMNFVMNVCDHIVVLDFGKKIAEGTPAEIRVNPLVISAYLGGDMTTDSESSAYDSGARK
jgi:ABC-type branched-subunit amino acid transport system ATPase component/branched-subunit amino acid ABC-type transport system permease component